MITNTERQTLARYFSAQPVDAVYLFGSQATGKENKLSDIDIAVLFQESLESSSRFDIKMRMIGDIGSILKRNDVEVLDLAQASPMFQYEAIAPKIVLYARNRARMVSLETDAIRKYIDLRPLLVRLAKRKLALLAEKGFVS